MTVLVTGGAGYIGSFTVRALLASGHKVVVVDSLEHGFIESMADGVPLVVANITDSDVITATCRDYNVDAVIHFAAYKAANESMDEPAKYFRNNSAGALELIDAVRAAGVSRFVFSSTAAVYGNPEVVPITEDSPIHPENPYGESKHLVERMLGWFDSCHDFRSVILRYFNAAGAMSDGSLGEDPSASMNLMPFVMKSLLRQQASLQIYGNDYPTRDGTCIRDYIHVEDLANAHVLALDYLERDQPSTIVNLGTGTGSTVLEVVAAAEAASGSEVPWEMAGRRPGDPACVVADNSRAAALLGWHPSRTLADIADSAWKWHSGHPHGFADL
jgi:UDP-glucose 4-epimerase